MENRLKRIEILLIILIILSSASWVTPLIKKNMNSTAISEEAIGTKELPIDLNKSVVDKIMHKIKTEFNHSDWEKMHNIYGEYAKVQLSPEQIGSEFKKMKAIVGNISTYAYSHYKYEGEADNADWFDFHYKCRFDNGKGTIKISTRTVDNISEVTGINMALAEI